MRWCKVSCPFLGRDNVETLSPTQHPDCMEKSQSTNQSQALGQPDILDHSRRSFGGLGCRSVLSAGLACMKLCCVGLPTPYKLGTVANVYSLILSGEVGVEEFKVILSYVGETKGSLGGDSTFLTENQGHEESTDYPPCYTLHTLLSERNTITVPTLQWP